MISNREIKGQIDELNEQNQLLTQELQQIKEMLQNHDSSQKQSQGQGSSQQQQQSQDSRGSSNESSGSNESQSGSSSNLQLFTIANDFIQLKGLISSLEKKMQSYTSQHSNGKSLTEEDVINLMLTMMNGMIDWTVDFVSNPNKKSTPLQ